MGAGCYPHDARTVLLQTGWGMRLVIYIYTLMEESCLDGIGSMGLILVICMARQQCWRISTPVVVPE